MIVVTVRCHHPLCTAAPTGNRPVLDVASSQRHPGHAHAALWRRVVGHVVGAVAVVLHHRLPRQRTWRGAGEGGEGLGDGGRQGTEGWGRMTTSGAGKDGSMVTVRRTKIMKTRKDIGENERDFEERYPPLGCIL